MVYPNLKTFYSKDYLNREFGLTRDDRYFLTDCNPAKDKNLLGLAILLKCHQVLGYPPREKTHIPSLITKHIAAQLDMDRALFQSYEWKDTVWKRHIDQIREVTGFRAGTKDDVDACVDWLATEAAKHGDKTALLAAAIAKFREDGIELASENEMNRAVNSGWNTFIEKQFETIFTRIPTTTREAIQDCLKIPPGDVSKFEWVKRKAGKPGTRSILKEIKKLEYIRSLNIQDGVLFAGIPSEILQRLNSRARPEGGHQMDRHPDRIKFSMMAVLLHFRTREITDAVIRMFMELVRRIKKKADKSLKIQDIEEIRQVYGKKQLLYRIAKASKQNPEGTVREVVFSQVEEAIIDGIIKEYEAEGTDGDYDKSHVKAMKKKYCVHYRQMLKPVLGSLRFHATNPTHQYLIDALDLVKKHMDSTSKFYPVGTEIPENLATDSWEDYVIVKRKRGIRIARLYFEVRVLRKLAAAIDCKEIWVEGSFFFRNPNQDVPKDWQENRIQYCERRDIPATAEEFAEPIRKEMTESIQEAQEFFSQKQDVYIYKEGGSDQGSFFVPKIEPRPERPILQEIKNRVLQRWGILDLLDVTVEADRQVGFSHFFETTGQRQVLSMDEVRERLMSCFFGIGTNLGLKRIHAAARPSCTYRELLYFFHRYVTLDPMREAVAALVNRILAIRNPLVWGLASSFASDARHIGSWDQNLVAEWNPHYQKCGVMAYWLVDTNALCVFSQLKSTTSSEVAAMIKALALHDTQMRIDNNFVDSHGQSEVAFPFCRFLHVELCPRLKGIKHERLYLPNRAMLEQVPDLASVIARPIRWKHIYNQYSEMAKHVVAVLERTGPVESVLRRFNAHNRNHPTYKAFVEAGKALKTIHLCKYLTRPPFRVEVNDGLNIVEHWNSANNFISYGRKSELCTNDPEMQELAILCIQLLQNALILVNTSLAQRVIVEEGFLNRMTEEDFRALTPLFTLNMNPYGYFNLNLRKPSILEVTA